jgi:hypothetical protein
MPTRRSAEPVEVDTIEQHAQLARIDQDRIDIGLRFGTPELATLEPLAPEHKAATIEGQDLDPVRTPGQEDKEVSAEDIQALPANPRRQRVKATAHVGGGATHVDPNRCWQIPHLDYPNACASCATYSTGGKPPSMMTTPATTITRGDELPAGAPTWAASGTTSRGVQGCTSTKCTAGNAAPS